MAKKTFKQAQPTASPAMSFITSAQAQEQGAGQEENKSKRYNLLIYPSLHEDLSKIAAMQRISVNELMNRALEGYRDEHKQLIEKYNQTFGEGE